MFSYEMIGVADQNNRTYISKYGTYSKADGFILNGYAYDYDIEDLLYELFHENCWSLREEKPKPKVMTKEEIEAALGYEIEINNDEKKDTVKVIPNERRKEVNDIFSFFFDSFK